MIRFFAILIMLLAFAISPIFINYNNVNFNSYAAKPYDNLLNKLPDNLINKKAVLIDFTTFLSSYNGFIKDINVVNNKIFIVMINNVRILYDDGKRKTFEEKLDDPDLKDMLSQLYECNIERFEKDYDPGRFRVSIFFNAIYGATSGEVKKNLVPVNFCGTMVLFNSKNGAAEALEKVSSSLMDLIKKRPELRKYIFPLGGVFNWRTIAKTKRLSPHSWGIAIDFNPKQGAYWQWGSRKDGRAILRIRKEYPAEIVKIFYDHGFIWGGSWSHYDLMHFEYRPELILKAKLVDEDHKVKYKLKEISQK